VAIIGKLAGTNIGSSKIVSAKDIILQASASMDLSSLKKYMSRYLFYCKKADREIIVIDDLDVIFEECDDSSVDYEKRIAQHAVIGLVDDLNATNKQKWKQTPFILGISSNGVANLSPDVSKIGRFEKNMVMNPPTEQQRSEILSEMLKHLPISQTDASRSKEECCLSWGSTIARHTSGCVAADLKRMCIDALTRSRARADSHTSNEQDARIEWSDVREAGRQCVPSQLSQLDVTMARNLDEESDNSNTLSPRDAFFQYWNSRFAGHDETKAKIYRSIVWPWKRHEGQGRRVISELERNVPPPSGVLFHGPSGTGKTFAAECLACSLGLNVVRVSSVHVYSLRFDRVLLFLILYQNE
jgi:transitional endoplasmic reticulum ATPase